MKDKETKYTNCENCPVEIREDCPHYEPNNLCIYDFLRARREREEKENK